MSLLRFSKLIKDLSYLQRNVTSLIQTPHKIYSTHQQKLPESNNTDFEIQHHANLASNWWKQDGVLRALHSLNEIRVPFIRDGLISHGPIDSKYLNTPSILTGIKILEIGCGGGILTEAVARLGATVTGIDLGEEVILTAQQHIDTCSSELKTNVLYKTVSLSDHVKENQEKYDAVVISEVLEHIEDKIQFLNDAVCALKPGGSLFITTLNKTIPMWVGGILLGEYVLKLAPVGTHHWDKLISPIDVQRILDTLDCRTVLVNGSTYDFWKNSWRWINSTNFCYALQAIKAESDTVQ